LIEKLEAALDSFDRGVRDDALGRLIELAEEGKIELAPAGESVNIHCHTFFSFNTYGYSPTKFAWLARKSGLAVAGIADFDVLDGLEEFYSACGRLGLKGVVGIETRVFIPEFADKEINSPGEPGVSYHMGVGMPNARPEGEAGAFLRRLKETAQRRNVELMGRVNAYLSPVELDYEADVAPLTPAGNPTERHLCTAYARKARAMFASDEALAGYWQEKLGLGHGQDACDRSHGQDARGTHGQDGHATAALGLPEGGKLLNMIRQKTMKQGGAGYVRPDAGAFPTVEEMNRFVLEAGGIATHTWLNGMSDGEQDIERLLEVVMSTGAEAINVIPDRNYAPGVKDEKLTNLYAVVELAERLDMPVVMGTEMNSPGQKFVDDFASAELRPLRGVFLKGARIVYGHTVLQRAAGMGYTSDWAKRHFRTRGEKNAFYAAVGERAGAEVPGGLNAEMRPDEVLKRFGG